MALLRPGFLWNPLVSAVVAAAVLGQYLEQAEARVGQVADCDAPWSLMPRRCAQEEAQVGRRVHSVAVGRLELGEQHTEQHLVAAAAAGAAADHQPWVAAQDAQPSETG